MRGIANFRIQNVRRYRLGILRAAGVLGMVVALLSFGAASRIFDLPMCFVSFLVGIGSFSIFSISSTKLQSANL
jgi:hypothetical protein